MEKFSLRPATEEDLSKIGKIERQAHLAPWTEENFRQELEKPFSHILVMTDDETDSMIAGYIVFWFMYEDCHILDLAVDLPYRGLGFARQMVRQAVTLAEKKGLYKIFLEVRKTNHAAIQLYQSLNFTITHVHKSFYSNGEDAYQMTLDLKGDGISF